MADAREHARTGEAARDKADVIERAQRADGEVRKTLEMRAQRRERGDETVACQEEGGGEKDGADGIELRGHCAGSERVAGDEEAGDEKHEKAEEHEFQPLLDEAAH